MAKPSLGDVQAAILDPMLSDNYQVLFGNLPLGLSSRSLLVQCRTASKPGLTINNVEVQLFGHTVEHASNLTYGHDMTIEYVENRSAEISNILESWSKMTRNPATQMGGYKSEYAVNAVFTIFDQKGNAVRKYQVYNLWPNQLPDLSFDGQASNLITLSVTFKYDWWEVIA